MRPVSLLALALTLAACQSLREELVLGAVPGLERPAVITQTSELGPYLNVVVERGDGARSLYFTPDAACREILREGEEVGLVNAGPYGRIDRGAVQCVPQGIGALTSWRERLTRGVQSPRERTDAQYRQVGAFEGGYALRGRFEGFGRVEWIGGYDTIVLIGTSEACGAVANTETATLEYRNSGPEAFVLLAGGGACPVEGLLRPSQVAAPPEAQQP